MVGYTYFGENSMDILDGYQGSWDILQERGSNRKKYVDKEVFPHQYKSLQKN